MTILDALDAPQVFSRLFPDARSWTSWRAFLRSTPQLGGPFEATRSSAPFWTRWHSA